MSSTKPETRTEFKNWCLRKLGAPVIRIDVAPEQVEDCIDQALDFFQRQHYDGSQKLLMPAEVTQKVKDQGYFKVDDSIFGITRILSINGTGMGGGQDAMLTYQWQMMAGAARQLSGCLGCSMCDNGMLRYMQYMQNMDMLRWLLGGNHTIMQWSRHTDKLYIWGNDHNMPVGTIIVAEVMRAIIPEEYPQVWNDAFLKRYCTALIKQQWGNNLRKLKNIPLAGGVMLQGEEILAEANEELATLHENMQSEWQEPPMPMVG